MTDADAFVAAVLFVGVFSVIAIVGWQAFKTWQVSIANRANLARDQAFQELADKAVYTQQRLLEQQERLLADMGDVRTRVVVIEQKLAEVD
jgi:hypothetical protein